MSAMAFQINSLTIVSQPILPAQIEENIKSQRQWPLWGYSRVTGEFLTQWASNPENVSIWWRHHGDYCISLQQQMGPGRLRIGL